MRSDVEKKSSFNLSVKSPSQIQYRWHPLVTFFLGTG